MIAFYYYEADHRYRSAFYLSYKYNLDKRSYKRLLKDMPCGIVILDEDSNDVAFYNNFIMRLASGRNTDQSFSFSSSEFVNRAESGKPLLIGTLKEIICSDESSEISLYQEIVNWKTAQAEAKNFFCRVNGGNIHFAVRFIKVSYEDRNAKAALLQDLSGYDMLSHLGQKYHKMYVTSIVHDIRTPLHSILGMLEMLEASSFPEQNKIYIAVAKNSCKLLTYLTNDISDYSQLESSTFKPSNENTSLKAIINEVSQLLEFNFKKKDLQQIYNISELVPQVIHIDKTRYIQILLNLLMNSLKRTFSGQIKIMVDFDRHNDLLITIVRDTGIGIKPEDLPKIFRVYPGITLRGEGPSSSGNFGLSIAKRLAESLGGYMMAASKVSYGSTFTFAIKANSANLRRGNTSIPSPRFEAKGQSSSALAINFRSTQPFTILGVFPNF